MKIDKSKVIYSSAFLTALSEGILTLGIIFYSRDVFGSSPTTIGLLGGIWALTYFTGCIAFKPLLKLIRPQFSMIISGLLMSLSVILILLSTRIETVFIFFGFFGLSLSLFWPQLMGWMSHGYEGKTLNRKISIYNLSWISGIIISPTICGFFSKINPALPLKVSSILFVSTSLFVFLSNILIRDIRHDPYRDFHVANSTNQQLKETLLRYPAWVGLFTTYLILGIVTNVFPVFAINELRLDKITIGNILLARGLGTAFAFIVLGKLTFWHFNKKTILLSQILLLLVIIFTMFLKNPYGLALIFTVFGLIFAFNYDESVFHGVTGSKNRSTRMAIHEALLTLGIVTGSSTGGYLLQHHSMITVYLFAIIVIILTIAVQAVMLATLSSST